MKRHESEARLDAQALSRLRRIEDVALESLGRATELARVYGVEAAALGATHVILTRVDSTGRRRQLLVRDTDRPVNAPGALKAAMSDVMAHRATSATTEVELRAFLEMDAAPTAPVLEDTVVRGAVPRVCAVRIGARVIDAAVYRRTVVRAPAGGGPLEAHEIDVVRIDDRDWPVSVSADGTPHIVI